MNLKENSKPDVLSVVTIDTEEDNWTVTDPEKITLRNIEQIPRMQEIFDDYGIVPTYMISYPVANNPKCRDIIKEIYISGRCDIGVHCHPWNTPPFLENRTDINSMFCNLSGELQRKKIKSLRGKFIESFDMEPKTFRCGRWGFNSAVGRNLLQAGFQIDSSITAFTDWRGSHGPDFSACRPSPFHFTFNGNLPGSGRLLEIPASIGYLQKNDLLVNSLYHRLVKVGWKGRSFATVAARLKIINRLTLSPETTGSEDMIRLAEVLITKGARVLNAFFHSSSLLPGCSPFVRDKEALLFFMERLSGYLDYLCRRNIETVGLSELTQRLSDDLPTRSMEDNLTW
jgi:hypothetical protein